MKLDEKLNQIKQGQRFNFVYLTEKNKPRRIKGAVVVDTFNDALLVEQRKQILIPKDKITIARATTFWKNRSTIGYLKEDDGEKK